MSKVLSLLGQKTRLLAADFFAFISSPVCAGCESDLADGRFPLCQSCQEQLDSKAKSDGPVCLICRSPVESPCNCAQLKGGVVPSAYYYTGYTELVRRLIHRYKFEGDKGCGYYLTAKATLDLATRLERSRFDLVIPLPMRKFDKNARGFNQSEMIAAELASALQLPMRRKTLRKIKDTKMQALLSGEDRWRNVSGAFGVSADTSLAGASVLLVDDIITTGATCFEAARALYSAGARNVTVFALASAHLD